MESSDLDSRGRIEDFVRAFYRDVAQDDLLGPVFTAAHVDWPAHIDTLTDFWSWQLLGARGYEGNPLRAHEPLHARSALGPAHFERWLAIFDETVDAHASGPFAELAKQRARRMARAMRRLLTGRSEPGSVALEPVSHPASPNVRSEHVEAH